MDSHRAISAAVVIAAMLLTACNEPTTQPPADINNQLNSVTCATTSHCIAVGLAGNPIVDKGARTLIEENSGGGWTIVPSPNPGPSLGSALRGVACAAPTRCIAVGYYSVGGAVEKPLIEENSGSGWNIVPSPNPNSSSGGVLLGVACADSVHCIAVGLYASSTGAKQALIEENTGGGWSIVPSPKTTLNGNMLNSVTCPDAGRCIAVGSVAGKALIEENTGSGWTVVPFESFAELSAVSCAPPTCVAVGFSRLSQTQKQALILEGAGSDWSATPAIRADGSLVGVTCADATSCVAIGKIGTGEPVIEQKMGRAWMLLPRLTVSTSERYQLRIDSVACAGADHCVIVGTRFVGAHAISASVGKTLVVENTGSGWAVVSSPNFAAGRSGKVPL